ncbi:MAG TPA: hypothetical protein VFV10_01505 [Gammaproteobacteria bacterium]|nr:hypothetical protein [Gammaproteobacteria bacterium]
MKVSERRGFAEELLSLVLSPERAESIAGDLAEEASREGEVWYWRSVLGISAAMFFKSFGAARLRTLGFLAAGFLVWCVLYAAIRVAGALLGVEPLIATVSAEGGFAVSTALYLGAALVLASFGAGLALGSRCITDGVNATAPLAMFWGVTAVVLPILDGFAGVSSWYCVVLYVAGVPLLYVLPLLAGGALARQRALRPRRTPV